MIETMKRIYTPTFLSFWLCVGLLAYANVSWASDLSSVRDHLTTGQYNTAVVEGQALQTAEGHALAAEALLTEVILGLAEKNKKQSKQARKLAEAALELSPNDQHARLQYAIADGFVTRETGNVSAWMKKLPQKTEAIVQAYRSDFPEDPRGDALMGAWHLAIARKTGDKDAQKWFGASINAGRDLFLTARAKDPEELVIGVSYAFALIALKDDDLDNTAEAQTILEDMVLLTPDDYLDETLKEYASEALVRLENRDAARDYVGLFLDGKIPE